MNSQYVSKAEVLATKLENRRYSLDMDLVLIEGKVLNNVWTKNIYETIKNGKWQSVLPAFTFDVCSISKNPTARVPFGIGRIIKALKKCSLFAKCPYKVKLN